MTSIDLRPAELEILAYAGDTVRLILRTEDDYSAATWRGSIKDTRDVDAVERATFSFGTPTLDVPTNRWVQTAKIDETDTASMFALVNGGGQPLVSYNGVWDIEVEFDDPDDPGVETDVLTLLQGTIVIDGDITKAP